MSAGSAGRWRQFPYLTPRVNAPKKLKDMMQIPILFQDTFGTKAPFSEPRLTVMY